MLIKKSVGDWAKEAVNEADEIGIVQTLLRAIQIITRKDLHRPLIIDKKISKPPKKSATVNHITAFQKKYMAEADGLVLPDHGKTPANKDTIKKILYVLKEAQYPLKPDFPAISGTTGRNKIFGEFSWEPVQTTASGKPALGSNITIDKDWVTKNIRSVTIPQLKGIPLPWGGTSTGMRFHKYGVVQLQGLWRDWEKAGLLPLIVSYSGAFTPRLMRGSSTALSSHAWGTAFDINAKQNSLKKFPPLVGEPGCLRDLVSIANAWGFYWGGHFAERYDGMHFELARIGVTPYACLTADI